MNMAFRKGDFKAAKKYGSLTFPSKKQRISQNKLLFSLFVLLKQLKSKLKRD